MEYLIGDLLLFFSKGNIICQGQLWVVILCAYVLLVISYPHRYMLLAWLQYYFLTILAPPQLKQNKIPLHGYIWCFN
jgi:hypothetical protein